MEKIDVLDEINIKGHKEKPEKVRTLLAKIVTTSGNHPKKGYEEVRLKEHVSKFLREAARALNLTDVTGWAATVDGNEIDPEKTFEENGLKEKVEIHWGPRVGGGG